MEWKNLRETLQDIEKRPGLFLGKPTITGLFHFMQGYDFALMVHGIDEPNVFDEWLSFHDWVALRTHNSESTRGWAAMLLEKFGGDEEKAFWIFFPIPRTFPVYSRYQAKDRKI